MFVQFSNNMDHIVFDVFTINIILLWHVHTLTLTHTCSERLKIHDDSDDGKATVIVHVRL